MDNDIQAVMNRVSLYLDEWDGILRRAHSIYTKYQPEFVVDHDSSTQAHCTYRHILAEAHRVFVGAKYARHLEVRGQNLWLFEPADVVIRFKKTDEDGISANYPTKQAQDFENGEPLPSLLPAPTRLNVGYLLDATGLGYVRSQVALPIGRSTRWCAAIVPQGERQTEGSRWRDVTRQPHLTYGVDRE